MMFESASKQIALFATRQGSASGFSYSQSAVSSLMTPTSLDLLELDAAIEKARSSGMRGRLKMARIETHRAADDREMPYWFIFPADASAGNELAFCLEGWTGTRVNCRPLQDR
jgi:hypothetical protein